MKRGEESISTAAKGKASIKQYITQKNADVRRSIPQVKIVDPSNLLCTKSVMQCNYMY